MIIFYMFVFLVVFVVNVIVVGVVWIYLDKLEYSWTSVHMYSRDCWTPILEYIEDQFDIFLEAETRVTRVQVNGEVRGLHIVTKSSK